MSIRKPIIDKEELLRISKIDLEKDSEDEIIYKFGLLLGEWNVVEISMLADYIYYDLYLVLKKVSRKFSKFLCGYLDGLSDWDFYNGRCERWSYDKKFNDRINKLFDIYSQKKRTK